MCTCGVYRQKCLLESALADTLSLLPPQFLRSWGWGTGGSGNGCGEVESRDLQEILNVSTGNLERFTGNLECLDWKAAILNLKRAPPHCGTDGWGGKETCE